MLQKRPLKSILKIKVACNVLEDKSSVYSTPKKSKNGCKGSLKKKKDCVIKWCECIFFMEFDSEPCPCLSKVSNFTETFNINSPNRKTECLLSI